jgi:hypothetical protein
MEVGELLVAHAASIGQLCRLHLKSCPALLIAVRGSWTEHEMAAGGGVFTQPRQKIVFSNQQASYDQHRQLGGQGGRFEEAAAVRPDDLDVVDQPRRHTSVERAAVEGFENPMVGPLIDVLE